MPVPRYSIAFSVYLLVGACPQSLMVQGVQCNSYCEFLPHLITKYFLITKYSFFFYKFYDYYFWLEKCFDGGCECLPLWRK